MCLHARFASRFCTLTHRDLLGAFMALGLTRDSVGDMIIEDADIFLFVSAAVADYVAGSLTSAGRASLRFEVMEEIPPMPEPRGQAFSAVISSMRLDAVLAAAYKLSRSEAAEAIRSGLVKVDHLPCTQTDARVEEGALLSLRGKGRVRLVSMLGTTRKQRISVSFFRYS
ncbi:MAG: YlmH/Sll1252 family protein [Candidatus Ventricola sp.]|nr:YlmH/Sll1252 family protein [Candidatus Ventricola sp.]